MKALSADSRGRSCCTVRDELMLLSCISFKLPHLNISTETKELTGDTVIAQEYCPLNGRYVFTYSVNDGTGKFNECSSPISELSNCPYGFGLGLRFKRCTFGDLGNSWMISKLNQVKYISRACSIEINFQCLGDWIGHNGERYMALLDVQDPSLTSNSEKRPRYRCAVSLITLYNFTVKVGDITRVFACSCTKKTQRLAKCS